MLNTASGIRVICSMATRHILAELGSAWEADSGAAFQLEAVGGVDAARRVAAGEVFDAVVLASDALETLAAQGHVRQDSLAPLACSGVAVAVRAGQPHPDISNEDRLKAAVVRARSIGHSTGPSGTQLLRLLAQWGVLDEIRTRIVQAPPGVPVARLIAQGDVELGFQQLSELLGAPGIEIVGPLPDPVQVMTVFSGAICRSASSPDVARAWLDFTASEAADDVKRRHGMAPAGRP
jgi:molybdate transport system substrate-binding protein